MRRAVALAALVPGLLCGCSWIVEDSDPTVASPSDGGATDAEPIAGCPGNLIVNPGFEAASIAPWDTLAANTTLVEDDAHSGDLAAKICDRGSVLSFYSLAQEDIALGDQTPPLSVRAEAYVKAPVSQTFFLRVTSGVVPSELEFITSSEWTLVEIPAHNVLLGEMALEIRLVSDDFPSEGDCIVVDSTCLELL